MFTPMAAAYAALVSLARSLRHILNLEQHVDPLHRDKIVALQEKVESIIVFLEDYSDKYRGTLDLVGNGITNAAYQAQDFMDSYLCSVSADDDDSGSDHWSKMSLDRDLNIAFERVDLIREEAAKMKNHPVEDLRIRPIIGHSSTPKITAKKRVVGFEDDLNAIKERLYEDSAMVQVIPIVGMGGIGKTTLARKAYEDSVGARQFDICAWITVSQQYQRRHILLRLLRDLEKPVLGQSGPSDAQLATLVYQTLMGRRYLVVIDDVWSTKTWLDLKMIFPEDGIKSRILLTTRLSDVAVYAGSCDASFHQMKLWNEDQSWKLLGEMVFGQESCPLQLVEFGKKIARNCRGLPLTIAVVAGLLLSTDNIAKQAWWENVSENISSTEPTIALHCTKILCLSYDELPLRLKPCFLYISAFSEDSEIDARKLIMLWVAEGFLKPSDQAKCLEEVGEWCLEDLVNRSLILVSQKGPDGKIQTIGIHDLLRDICVAKAEEETFLHHVSSTRNAPVETVDNPNRRLDIHCTQNRQEWRILDASVRAVLFFRDMYWGPRLSLCCRRLSILDIPHVTWPKLAAEISTFVYLRYIAFSFNYASRPDAASISKLPNLQTIIAHNTDLRPLIVPYEILGMPKLRHLIMNTRFDLACPSNTGGIIRESDLQTLETVINFRFTEEAIEMLASLKKLTVEFHVSSAKWDDLKINNLFYLKSLEELKVSMFKFPNFSMTWNHAFPTSLKNLTLERVPLPWENMTIIGSLPNLRVLKMMHIEVDEESEWAPVEGQFLQLKYFCSSLDNLVSWEVEREHFPSLETLCLNGVRWIDEIPCGVGEMHSLQLIELWHCPETLVDSAKRIQEQQHDNGNDDFEVHVHGAR